LHHYVEEDGMDILHLLDRLEELFNESREIPFTHSLMIDGDRLVDLIDNMKVAIPDEIKEAKRINSQRDRILAQAKEEAERTIALAREKSTQIIENDQVVLAAQARAQEIISQAQREAVSIRQDADQYVVESLEKLQRELERTLTEVRNGIRMIRQDLPQPVKPEDGE
jgi:cell division septum initiation protein DivIVA